MSFARIPGYGIARGMLDTLVRFFQPKVTIQYPEVVQEISPHSRGRLILLYDEAGNLKCETCFQCAMACPIEIIDMGGVDTRNRIHVHWGPPEQYAERREESALRRSGRTVPDRAFAAWQPIDLGPLEEILVRENFDPRHMVGILEQTQQAYGYLPVAALQHISHSTGAWYSEIYGTGSSFGEFNFSPAGPGGAAEIGICRCPNCVLRGAGRIRDALTAVLGVDMGGVSADGAVRFVTAECGGDPALEPLVTLNGQAQPDITPERAADLARGLRAAAAKAGRA